jgi:hypothetical protein
VGQVSGLRFVTHAPPKARDATQRTLFQVPPHLLIIALAAAAVSPVATIVAILVDQTGWLGR